MNTIEAKLLSMIKTVEGFPVEGVSFKDITPVLRDPQLYEEVVDIFVGIIKDSNIDAIIAPESRGFLFGAPVAIRAQVPLVIARKPGKLPRDTFTVNYGLEYGENSLSIHKDSFTPGARVAIMDDLMATFGSAEACCQLAELAGAKPVLAAFLIKLQGFEPPERKIDMFNILTF